jgi:hypothetical protein
MPGHQERQRQLDRHRHYPEFTDSKCQDVGCTALNSSCNAKSTVGSSVSCGPCSAIAGFVTPLENDEERLDAAHGELSVHYHAYDNIIGAGEHMSGLAVLNLIEELNLMSTGESCTFAEAEQDVAWQAAMQEEINSVKQNQTWELADLPQGHCAITLK